MNLKSRLLERYKSAYNIDPNTGAPLITKSLIERLLTGVITSHSHPSGGGGMSQAQILTRQL